MTVHEKINVRSYYNNTSNRVLRPYSSTIEELIIWKRNEKPFTNLNRKY